MSDDWKSDDRLTHRSFRLVDLVAGGDQLVNRTFEDCTIYGPAVVILLGNTEFVNNQLNGDSDAILWEIPDDRTMIIGAIALIDCTVRRCVLQGIGLAGNRKFVDTFRQSLRGSGDAGQTR